MKPRGGILFVSVLALGLLLLLAGQGATAAQAHEAHGPGPWTSRAPTAACVMTTTLVSVATDGQPGNLDSDKTDLSADGRYVVFVSGASDLVSGDGNDAEDVFVYDRQLGQMDRVSVASNGTEGNLGSNGWGNPSLSADGRYVAFISEATNLVTDTNSIVDIFVHDRTGDTTVRVSVASNGTEADGESGWPAMSGNGRYVAFWSAASSLAAGDTNGALDIFIHDLQTHQTRRIAVGSAGDISHGESLDISYDGRYVAFNSPVDTLVLNDNNGYPDVFLYDTQTSQFSRVSVATGGGEVNSTSRHPSLSANGQFVAFASLASNLVGGDTNGVADIFVRDRILGVTTRVSVSSAGTQANGDSGVADDQGESCAISDDGRFVAFFSHAINLVSNDNNGFGDVFVRDRFIGQTTRVSVAGDGTEANGASQRLAIAGNGQYVAFGSDASNLIPNDVNSYPDIFVRTWCPVELRAIYLPLVLRNY